MSSLVGDLFPAGERGRIYGFVLSGELIGAAVGFLLSGDIAAALSWRFAFWVLAAPSLILAWAIWRLFPEPARGGRGMLSPGQKRIRDRPRHDRTQQRDTRPAASADRSQVEQEVEDDGIIPHRRHVLHKDPASATLWWAVRYVLSIRTNISLIIASALGYFYFTGLRTFAVVLLRGRFGLGQAAASSLLVAIGLGAIVGVLLSGRIADWLFIHHYIAGRPVIAGVCFLLTTVLLVPRLLVHSLVIAVPLLFIAAIALGGTNPPLDASRLDIMHSRLWGRVESVRTVLRAALVALAPLLFGLLSGVFGGTGTDLGYPATQQPAGARGLDDAFLIMLVPLVIAALILLLGARRSYPSDVATAVTSERATAASDATDRGASADS